MKRKGKAFTWIVNKLGNLINPATEETLQSINTKADALANLDTQLSTIASEETLAFIKRNIIHLIKDMFSIYPVESLKFSGDFSSGTYTVSYTPASNEKVFIHGIILNSYAGRGELRLYWGDNIIAQCSVDASYYEMNAESEIQRTVVGDGTTALTLELVVNASTSYFGKAVARRIELEEA